MAPAAKEVIRQHFEDFGRSEKEYDRIITGDLGTVGQKILIDLLLKTVTISVRYTRIVELKF